MKRDLQRQGGGSFGSVTLLLFFAAYLAASATAERACAALLPPSLISYGDTLSSSVDRGVELTRFEQRFTQHPRLHKRLTSLAHVVWKTDRRTPEQEADRIRQDGRWYAGTEHRSTNFAHFWTAAEGEHFDDRPVGTIPARFSQLELQPDSPDLAGAVGMTLPSAINSVRIVRGGGGVSLQPANRLRVDAGAGIVEDRRLGRIESGFASWTRAKLDDLLSGGYVHSAELEFDRETPLNHQNLDLRGHYGIFREFFPGNSNQARLSASLLQRDIYLDQSGTLSKREDRRIEATDVLKYRIRSTANLELAGELLHDVTEQSQVDQARSRLEENQAGLRTQANVEHGSWVLQGQAGWRFITQTIREDVLQGQKADLSVGAAGPIARWGQSAIRLGVAKYQLDTKSNRNFDDRDELRYVADVSFARPITPTARIELGLSSHLDHLVYIFRQKSANNRWSRYLGLTSKITHRPSRSVMNSFRTLLSANYVDYDYETGSRVTRSNVFRRLLGADSLQIDVAHGWRVRVRGQGQIEEFGKLFWDSFEEERSDETRSYSVGGDVAHKAGRDVWVGCGGLWDSRRSVRFPTSTVATEEVAQDYRAYGPTWFVERMVDKGMFVRINGRHLRQFRLDKEDRWLFTGEGVLAWQF